MCYRIGTINNRTVFVSGWAGFTNSEENTALLLGKDQEIRKILQQIR